jgi:hypothetical protein
MNQHTELEPTTDRELLELAARATGAELTGYRGSEPIYGMPHETSDGTEYIRWNPLTDDGDALRLVVKLNISINRPIDGDSVQHFGTYADDYTQTIQVKERDNGDPYAATRRAIVRAAAEIGKVMPCA